MANGTASRRKEDLSVDDPTSYARAHGERRREEPAAAPMETDNEAGAGSVPRREPADTYVVDSAGDVRAGPGDAGKQDAPQVMDQPPKDPPRRMGAVVGLFAAGAVVLALVYLFTA